MTTLVITHLLIGILGYAMGWAMQSRRQKSIDQQLEQNYYLNISELKRQLSPSQYN